MRASRLHVCERETTCLQRRERSLSFLDFPLSRAHRATCPLCGMDVHHRLFGFVLNPTDQTLDPESYLLLDAAADEMRAVQGLLDDALVVPRGFISRGMPLRSLQDLAKQMHEHHTQYRRLGARADEL